MEHTVVQAEHDAGQAQRRSSLNNILALLSGEENELLPFDAVKNLRPHGEHYRGMQAVELEKIIGSVDRYKDFDMGYLPKSNHVLDRWANIRRLKLQGTELPPIQVYKVGQTFFVKDGNHRVSVAQAEGQKYIDAEVIELDVVVPPEPGDDLKTLIIKGEYAKFLEQTKLNTLRPNHAEIMFSTPGRYDVLLDHIRTRQYFLGINLQRDVAWEEAVSNWYDRLYKHMIDEMRAGDALHSFPGRTEADLYLWMMDHRYYLTKNQGHDVGSKEATMSFTRHHRPPLHARVSTRFALMWQDLLRRIRTR